MREATREGKRRAKGSSTAPPALTEGRSHLTPMSRKMKPKEVKAFELEFGHKPTAIRVAIDALALGRYLYIYVNKHPEEPLPALVSEFIKLVLSESGQEVVASVGYVPLPQKTVEKELMLASR